MTTTTAEHHGQGKTRLEKTLLLIFVIVPFLATIAAIVLLWNRLVTWTDLALFIGLYAITGLGITIGYHRMITHNAFKAHPIVRFLLLAAGGMAVERGPVSWASTHLEHHAHSDKEGDPHSPLDGLYHAHLGWMFAGGAPKLDRHGPWLQEDEMAMFFERTFPFWVALGLIIPFAIGGWTGLLWGGGVRIFITHHATWSVNSICHTFGGRDFETPDASRNNFIVGLLALGEGWHNNHHAFPNSAFHGMRWWQIDVSSYIIRAMEKLGLVWDVRRVSPEHMARRQAS